MVITKAMIEQLVKERKVVFEAGGDKRLRRNELKEKDLWETLEKGFLVTKQEFCTRFPDKKEKYTLDFYYIYKRGKIFSTYLLIGFYVHKDVIRIRHFSPCSAEVKIYRELENSQNSTSKN